MRAPPKLVKETWIAVMILFGKKARDFSEVTKEIVDPQLIDKMARYDASKMD